jgi:thiamine-phosphate pyrophosphorylase
VREALAVVAITDNLRDGIDGLVARALAAERGGATMLQVRLKQASSRELLRVTRSLVGALHIPVLVNDRVDIAVLAEAAGAHLGMQDVPIMLARTMVPENFLLGASLGSAAELPELDDADYAGVGPIFDTPSKADAGVGLGIERAAQLAVSASRPVVAIGGIDAGNTAPIVAAGFDGVSVIRAVLSQTDPETAARELRAAVARGLSLRDAAQPHSARTLPMRSLPADPQSPTST